MTSSRLPGKILSDIAGRPALSRMLARLRLAKRLDGIVLATTDRPTDDATARWAETEGVACFRGSEDDVLARVVGAQRSQRSEIVVELCGDCPLIDPQVIDRGVESFLAGGVDVVSTTQRSTYPRGLDVQVFRLDALEHVAETIDDPPVREHVSLYFYEHPERYRVHHLTAPADCLAPELRCVLDYPADREFISEVYRLLEPKYGDAFGAREIVALLQAEPALADINRHCQSRAAR